MHYPPYLKSPAEQSGEVANSAWKQLKNSTGATVDIAATLKINTQTAHQIELADGSHQRSWVPQGLGLASRLDQGLNAPSQHLLPVEIGAFDVVKDLTPSPLDEPIAL